MTKQEQLQLDIAFYEEVLDQLYAKLEEVELTDKKQAASYRRLITRHKNKLSALWRQAKEQQP